MIPKDDKDQRRKMIERVIESLIRNQPENQTKWEENFIESIREQFMEKGDLTDRQCEILERLYDKL